MMTHLRTCWYSVSSQVFSTSQRLSANQFRRLKC